MQPFCFLSYGEINEGYEKGDEINPCKGEANPWEQESSPCQREKNICKAKANLCKGEANLCKGETFEKWCSPGRNLEKKQLAKVGAAVLSRQNQKKAENNDDENEAAKELQLSMTPAEKSRTWSKHQTHLNKDGNEEERDAFNNASKNEKGELTALFLMRKEAAKFCDVSRSIGTKQEVTMTEHWLSEKEALEKWGDDSEKHCASGRVQWRQCKTTWGVYEYMDTQDYTKTTTGTAKRSWI